MDKDRKTAFLILKDIEENSSWSNLSLNRYLKNGEVNSPAFVRELVYGVIRNRILLDVNIDALVKKIKLPDRIILRMGLYQICFMDSAAEYAAVNESVELAKSFAKGRDGFINAVLRNFIRKGSELKSKEPYEKYSCQPWIYELFKESYGKEKAEDILYWCSKPAELSIRANTLKITKEELDLRLADIDKSRMLESELYKNGYFSVQGTASQTAVKLLDPKPGDTLVDMCAAPGGKSCAAAELMQNRGKVFSFDLYEHRVKLIKKEAVRLGIDIITAQTADASVFDKSLENTADCIICDVPCSGLGVIRKKPEIKLTAKEEEVKTLPMLQLSILNNAARYLKSGGRLLYSTCTVNPAENSGVIKQFTDNNPEFEILEERLILPDKDNQDGFYICLMGKKNG